MNEAVNAVFNLDERTKVRQVSDSAMNAGSDLIAFMQCLPWIVLYLFHPQAYAALKLPPEFREGDRAKRFEIPEETLMALFDVELEDDYYTAMLAEGNQAFADADKRFDEGRAANDTGDTFDLIGVIYTVSLFFAGIALVFRSSLRWIMLYVGTTVFVGASIYLFLTPWA